MAVRVTLECGHTSVLRSRTTKEGYTHDWEVFLRGVDHADVQQYIEKVVFILHDTFPKPKRVIKEPPYAVRESGYAGFVIPINVYWKRKDEPKKFQILYDLHLQQSGPAINKVIRYEELFPNPPDEFRRKLLKGGATIVSSLEGTQDKGEPQATLAMIGKPKLSGSDVKKHRPPEPRTSNSFRDLFGEPINKAKVSPDNKKVLTIDKGPSMKPTVVTEKVDKPEKISKVKHSPHKDGKRDKVGEGDKKAEKKDKEHFRERERSKEKSKRPQSPAVKISHSSPSIKRVSSPLPPPKKPPSPSLPPPAKKALSPKREKDTKKPSHEREKERDKEKEKARIASDPISKGEKRKEKKKHKEEREKDKKDKHKERDRDKSKENAKYTDKMDKPEQMKQEKIDRVEKQVDKQVEKLDKGDKERSQEARALSKEGRKSPRPKEMEKSKPEEKPVKIEKPEKVEKPEKSKEGKGEREKQKHKHKKRDKKDRGDGSKEREKKEKKERSKSGIEKQNNVIPPPQTNPLSTLLAEMPERDSSDSAPSPDDDMPIEPKQAIVPKDSSQSPPPPAEPPRPTSPPPPVAKKEKSEKVKRDKSKGSRGEEREGRKRKRRNSSKGEDEPAEKGTKREKERVRSPSLPLEPVSSSQSPVATDSESTQQSKNKDEECEEDNAKDRDGEAEQVAPDSTNNTLAEVDTVDPPVFSEDYVSQLKDLQQKIMTLQDNQELQRVVQVIAETGQYEITKKTFDFDLCALDRRTVQRLQEFFSTS